MGKYPIHISLQQKRIRHGKHFLRFILLLFILVTALGILSSSSVYNIQNISLAVTRLLGRTSDLRYISHLEINWDEISQVLEQLHAEMNEVYGVGLVNLKSEEVNHFQELLPKAKHTILQLVPADMNLNWDSLYPKWIDEEQEHKVPNCPSLPKLQVPRNRLDLVVVKLPWLDNENWMRDVPRLHLQLAAAGFVTSAKGRFPVHLLFITKGFPIPNLFTCKELVVRRGFAWLYRPNRELVTDKLNLPIGSCELALPLGVTEEDLPVKKQREAYATMLVGAQVFVCGAIALAQSIRRAGSSRDLVILVDEKINDHQRNGLAMAGWKVRIIKGIRNPKAQKGAYNGWNYSKFRLWQLTDYDKIIYVDSDLLILRSIDTLFAMPEITAGGDRGTIFNAGMMVIEPSNCTFRFLMDNIYEIDSPSGGDQGYVNEIFTWWHRMPIYMNFLKDFSSSQSEEMKRKKARLIEHEPPVLYAIHYLGFYKPWTCPRDYDCNWNVGKSQEFASDDTHRIWWKAYDAMPEELKEFCALKPRQRAQLEYDRRQAELHNYSDGHWRIVIQDPRYTNCTDYKLCNARWKKMLWLWGKQDEEQVKISCCKTGANQIK